MLKFRVEGIRLEAGGSTFELPTYKPQAESMKRTEQTIEENE